MLFNSLNPGIPHSKHTSSNNAPNHKPQEQKRTKSQHGNLPQRIATKHIIKKQQIIPHHPTITTNQQPTRPIHNQIINRTNRRIKPIHPALILHQIRIKLLIANQQATQLVFEALEEVVATVAVVY